MKFKQIISGLLTTALLVGSSGAAMAAGQEAFWPTFRKDNSNMAIVDTRLPIGEEQLTEKWNLNFYENYVQKAPSEPVIVGDKLFVVAGKKLNQIDSATGKIIKSAPLIGNQQMGFFSRLTYGDGKIFVPVTAGLIQAFDAETMEPLWCTELVNATQTLCQVTYDNGYLYTGYWRNTGVKTVGKFFCVDTNAQTHPASGEGNEPVKLFGDIPVMPTKWESEDNTGFYWSGAAIAGDAVIYGGDSGILYSANRETGEIIDHYQTDGMIRSCIAQDSNGDLYFTAGEGDFQNGSNEGYVYKVGCDESGRFTTKIKAELDYPSTCNPMVYNGRVYVPMGKQFTSEDISNLSVFNSDDLSLIYNIEVPGCSKASPLLTTAYATEENNQTVYLYITINNEKGQIARIEDNAVNTTPKIKIIYTPEKVEGAGNNNTTASLVSDQQGTIYYHNDNGRMMALTGYIDQPDYVLGDVNGDGAITSADALLALQASVGKGDLTEKQTLAADVDHDKKVTSSDALLILQYSVGKIIEF
ncbi:dockerin type I domain-containing protein [Eubacterium callanderi]|uniref:dockerin type I domain-containing protein n=1 Tax=Eubacterium callanderi TaxID=53442 RepID=UPI00391B5831